MIVLGIETSCDETGAALYCTRRGLLSQALHSQVAVHRRYGGVVPELASRDHIRRLVTLIEQVLTEAGVIRRELDAVAWTEGPGLAGALLVGAGTGAAIAFALDIPGLGIHHLEGHLLSPLLSSDPPAFPFVALLVSGGHTQLMEVTDLGRYRLLGDTLDDAAGEAFDKSAKLLGLGYPGGPEIARLAATGTPGRIALPRPMLHADNLDFSFSGLKTAVATHVRRGLPPMTGAADLAAELEASIVDVLTVKSIAALHATGLRRLVVAGGVSANLRLRKQLLQACAAKGEDVRVFFPEPQWCADNGAMIALAGALHLQRGDPGAIPRGRAIGGFTVRPRWPLDPEPKA